MVDVVDKGILVLGIRYQENKRRVFGFPTPPQHWPWNANMLCGVHGPTVCYLPDERLLPHTGFLSHHATPRPLLLSLLSM